MSATIKVPNVPKCVVLYQKISLCLHFSSQKDFTSFKEIIFLIHIPQKLKPYVISLEGLSLQL